MFENFTKTRTTLYTGNGLLQYGEASVMECFELADEMQKNDLYLLKFLEDFIDKYSIVGEGLEKVKLEELDISKLWNQIKDTYFKGFFVESDKNEDKSQQAPFDSVIHHLGKELGQDPFQILNTWTYPQFQTWMNGFSWNIKEQTEEGRKENDIWRNENKDHDFIKSKLSVIDDIFKNLDERIAKGEVTVTGVQKVQSK